MRLYDVGVVIRGDLAETDMNVVLETVQGWIEATDGTVENVDYWGRRRLQYEVAGQRDGYYVFLTANMYTDAPAEIERNMRLSEDVIRFMITREEA